MKPKRLLLFLVCAVMSLVAIAMAPSAAAADEVQPLAYEENQARDANWTDTPKDCHPEGLGGKGCVQPNGDVLWLLDRWTDGKGVSLTWWEYRPTGGGFYERTDRWGKCIDNRGKDVGWTVCDKDFTEGNLLEWTVQYWNDGAWQHVGPWYTIV